MRQRNQESTSTVDSSVPLTHRALRDLGFIYLVMKCKIRFQILSDLRIQPWIFLQKRILSEHTHSPRLTLAYFIVHSTKLLNFDWSRAVQFIPNCTPYGVPIKFQWKRRNFVECTISKKSHDLHVQFVNNRYS